MEKKGVEILREPRFNKSTAFSTEEKEQYGLRGLLPYAVTSQELQKQRVLANIRIKDTDLQRYIFLSQLQDRNERLFYSTIMDNIPELMPIIYTPTVGEACQKFSHIFRIAKGFYVTPDDKGHVADILDNWPEKDVRVIVVTDGSRILGLGDLGSNGMGIPIGKLSLYTAGAGIDPKYCMPVMLDLGTDNETLRTDPVYLGYPHPRLKGQAYDEMIDEFVQAVQIKFPQALIQFEDFVTDNAYKLLERYKDQVLCFNDDIQGTASIAAAGFFTAIHATNKKLGDQKIMFYGAGSASTGIADLIIKAYIESGLSEEASRKKIWLVDSKGLIVQGREDLTDIKAKFAQDHAPASFLEAVKSVQPTVLIGAAGNGRSFTKEVIEAMASFNERPVIFALSNPTSKAECTAEEAYTWSNGKAIFASGSPFNPVVLNGKTHVPGQGNNVYIFPGIGLATLATEPKYLPDSVFLVAAKIVAGEIQDSDLEQGTIYPKLSLLRDISLKIAIAIAEHIYELGLARITRPDNLETHIRSLMYDPSY
ncbi:MAG: NAD-dependent malic enzyme [Chitinophagales bacterium]|nr:NAD-dependent malic enzyme [Chitinophagales bacterium]